MSKINNNKKNQLEKEKNNEIERHPITEEKKEGQEKKSCSCAAASDTKRHCERLKVTQTQFPFYFISSSQTRAKLVF